MAKSGIQAIIINAANEWAQYPYASSHWIACWVGQEYGIQVDAKWVDKFVKPAMEE